MKHGIVEYFLLHNFTVEVAEYSTINSFYLALPSNNCSQESHPYNYASSKNICSAQQFIIRTVNNSLLHRSNFVRIARYVIRSQKLNSLSVKNHVMRIYLISLMTPKYRCPVEFRLLHYKLHTAPVWSLWFPQNQMSVSKRSI